MSGVEDGREEALVQELQPTAANHGIHCPVFLRTEPLDHCECQVLPTLQRAVSTLFDSGWRSPAVVAGLVAEIERLRTPDWTNCAHGVANGCRSHRCGSNCDQTYDRMHPCLACMTADFVTSRSQRDEARAEVERLREDRDLRATRVEEAQSVLAMVKDRVDDFTYDEFASVLEDGPIDDDLGDIIPSPLRRERDEAERRLGAVAALADETPEWSPPYATVREQGNAEGWNKMLAHLRAVLAPVSGAVEAGGLDG